MRKKRRLRAPSETVREKTQSSSTAKPKKAGNIHMSLGKVFGPVTFIFKPIRWLGRYLVPRYFKQAFSELKNITWPSRKQARQLTTAVVLFAIVFGALVSSLDYGLDKVFKKVFLKE
jgi:preprotein translocase SecE subunit